MNKLLGTRNNFMLECLYFSINFNLSLDPRQEKDNTKLVRVASGFFFCILASPAADQAIYGQGNGLEYRRENSYR